MASKVIGRFRPVTVEMPRWFFGGDPTGLANFCGWQLGLEDTEKWLWKVQTRETVDGTSPSLVRVRRLSRARAHQSESLYDPLLELATRDAVHPSHVWEKVRAVDTQSASSEQRTISSSVGNIRNLIMAAPDAATLRTLMPQVAKDRIRPAFPRSNIWFIDTPRD